MGTTLLVIAVAIEGGFATYCVTTKSYQQQVKSIVRIAALAAFVLATLVSVIAWGGRWYGLAALLLVWAVLGARTLQHTGLSLRGGRQDKGYTARRSVLPSAAQQRWAAARRAMMSAR